MHTHSHKLWLGRLFALAPLALGAAGCFTAVVGEEELCPDDVGNCEDSGADGGIAYGDSGPSSDAGAPGCFFEGQSYSPGHFVTDDGCACKCDDHSAKVYCETGCAYTDGGSWDAGPPAWGDAEAPSWDAGPEPWYDGGPSYDAGKPWRDVERVYFDAGKLPYTDAGPRDGGVPYYDGGKPDGGWWVCELAGQSFMGTVLVNDGCDTCTCHTDGTTFCTRNDCLPDGGAGTCDFFGVLPVGGHVNTGHQCDTCACVANGQLSCETKDCPWGNGYPPVDGGIPEGTCEYEGNLYRLGDPIVSADKCQKCTCMLGGTVVCDTNSCASSSGCYIDETKFSPGEELVCPDGCNTCTCGSKVAPMAWSKTALTCPALPAIMACPASVSSSAFPAQLVYREGDAVAVVDSRCVNGQTLDYGLCWDGDLSAGVAQLYVFSSGAQRACNAAAQERVFSLVPLRQALIAAFPGTTDVKVGLRGSDGWLNYTFRAP